MNDEPREPSNDDPPEMTPTVACTRCDQEWELTYELEELHAGNSALEQFAMDHYRHTGHYPDDVTPYQIECRVCPQGDQFLSERPARRFARTHARHTRHTLTLQEPEGETEQIQPAK